MADKSDKPGVLARIAAKIWDKEVDKAQLIPLDDVGVGYDGMSISTLLQVGQDQARTRAQIYEKWAFMMSTDIISSALRLHVTAALGGHETSGDVVFIEPVGDAEKEGSPGHKIVKELIEDLSPLFNRIAFPTAFKGTGFGDAYVRTYLRDGEGLVGVYTDELVYPPLIQPYEQGSKNVGFVVTTLESANTRLTNLQMTRLKMPRLLWTPQMRVIEKAQKTSLKEDSEDEMPVLPAMAGGSFLEGAEEAFDNLMKSMTGLLGQRVLDSIDESIIAPNFQGTTLAQRTEYVKKLKAILGQSKQRAEEAIKANRPILQRFYHIIPTWAEKMLTTMQPFGSGKQGNLTIDDVMFHAKKLAGALGIDLSMLGFSELLSGGLGDGGFFRVSAQSAERSRLVRVALTDFFNDLIDKHCYSKYGWVFDDKKRPYKINFYGSISALETEKQRTRENQMNSGLSLVTVLTQMKDVGLDQPASTMILTKVLGLDDEDAKTLSTSLQQAIKSAKEEQAGAFGGGPGFDPSKTPTMNEEEE